MFVKIPSNKAEIETISDVYERVGLPGCVGSSDGVDLHWGCCPAMPVEAHKGKDGVPSRGFNVSIALLVLLECVHRRIESSFRLARAF